jgi:ankyrin repeat protein
MGCILYELAVGQKPFRDDFATIEHKRSEGVLEVLLDESFGERCKESVTKNILWMLRIEASERPSARELFDEFQRSFRDTRDQCHYGLQIHRDFHKAYKSTINRTDSLNSWVEGIISLSHPLLISIDLDLASDQTHSTELEPLSEQLIGCGINDDSSEDEGNRSIQRCLEAVDKDPMNYWLWNSLCNLYIAIGDLDSAIEACKHGINLHGTNPSPSMALSNLYAAKGDFKSAIEIGTQLHRFESGIVLLALTQFRDPFTTIKQQSERYLTYKEIIDRSLGRLDLGRNGAVIKTWLSATWFSTDGPEMNMYLAAWTGNVESMKANIRRGGNVMSPDNFGWTTLHLAVWNMHTEAIMFLLDAPVTASKWVSAKNRWSVSSLTLAARNNDVPTITALENAGAEIWTSDEDGLTPLHWAANEGHLAAITALSKRADVSARDKNGRTAIHLAASRGHVEVINQLDGDILARDNDGHTPMNLAIQREQVDVIKALEKLGVDVSTVDEGGRTLLHIAAEFGGVKSIQALKELGADISARDQEEWTAMHFAACGGYAKTIDALKRAGAKVSVLSKTKRTPMHFAAERGHLEAIKALKDAGANFSMQDKNGMTPMHLEAVNGHTEVVKTLQQYGASVSAPQNQGQTPMHFAAGSGHVGVIKILKALGADVSAQDKGGSRPLDLASRNGHLLASQLLKTPSSSGSSQEPKAVNTQAFRRGNRKRR